MKSLRRVALFASALLVSLAAFAATVNWTAPTANTDGSAIPATGPGSIASYRIEYGTCNGTAFGTKAGEIVVNAPALTGNTPPTAPGTWCYRMYAVNTFGVESDPTNVVSKVIAPPKPNPPGNFTVL